ncbi:MAG: 6-phosphofructokinase [Dethiosulfovibrio peptidovorans]|nr:MAG: 6-phosphofructokinase [Dethiosulfovibrio peptidovorans]
MNRIAVLTSGGDAPGMNAAIRAVVRSAVYRKVEVYGVYQGYEGLMDGAFQRLEPRDVGGIIHRGGTVLRTARSERFQTDQGMDSAVASIDKAGIEGLVVIGGDGSFRGGWELHKRGVPVVGIPGTIDNDVAGTDETIGYDTALNTALEAVKKLRDTASSHDRLFIVEVMGREAGFLALNVAVASGAEFVVVPERKLDVGFLCERLHQSRKAGKQHSLIIVAEGAISAVRLKEELKDTGGYDARVTVLGYIQRGGSPTSFDTILASRMGAFAVENLLEGGRGIMIGSLCHRMVAAPLSLSWEGRKPLNPELIELIDTLSI